MIITNPNYYDWYDAPIQINIDEEMADFAANILKCEIKKAIENEDFRKGRELLHSLSALEDVLNKAAEAKAEKAKSEEDADPENDWVYISTGVMPTHDNDVLVTCEYEGDRYVVIDSHHEDGWINNDSVVAWRELPEPAEPAEDADA